MALPLKKRKELRKFLAGLKEKIEKQNEILHRLFLKPNEDTIKAIKLFLKGEMSYEEMIARYESRNKRNKEVFECFKLMTKDGLICMPKKKSVKT